MKNERKFILLQAMIDCHEGRCSEKCPYYSELGQFFPWEGASCYEKLNKELLEVYYGYTHKKEEPTPIEKERWFDFLYAFCLKERSDAHDFLELFEKEYMEGRILTASVLQTRAELKEKISFASEILALMDKFSMEEN